MLAVNKMDLVEFSQQTFNEIENDYRKFAVQIGLDDIQGIPVSAVFGDNVVKPSRNTSWYSGPTLMHFLETVTTKDEARTEPFRMPVQWVNRPNPEFRGFAGLIAGGTVRPGDRVRVGPSGAESEVARIVTASGDLQSALAGQSVTLTLTSEIDLSRGDVLSAADTAPPQVADQFEATLIWMHNEPMLPGRTYVMKIGARTVSATVAPLKYRINVNSLEHTAAERLELNDIGVVEINSTSRSPSSRTRRIGRLVDSS